MRYSVNQLHEIIERKLSELAYMRHPQGLYEPIRYVLSLGGKRIRPTLMMLAYNLYKDNVEDICMQALAIETYHNHTLLHDDLMDHADMRRGHATVHEKWNENVAILSGDAMLLLAYRLMNAGLDDGHMQVLDVFTETAIQICEGQQLDMEFETRMDVTVPEYMEMIRLKTSVLLACALKIGALLADAPTEDAELLYDFGINMGLAFQLQDDYLDVYGNPDVFGKNIGGDIVCNKKTFMLISALHEANESQRTELTHWLSATNVDAEEKIAAVTHIYNMIGVPQQCERQITSCFDKAMQIADRLNVPEDVKQTLVSYTRSWMNRAY